MTVYRSDYFNDVKVGDLIYDFASEKFAIVISETVNCNEWKLLWTHNTTTFYLSDTIVRHHVSKLRNYVYSKKP